MDGQSRVHSKGRRGRSIVYVHIAAETMLEPEAGVARIEGYGPLSTASLPEFLAGSNVTVRPVVDPALLEPVDSYEIPRWIREAVFLGVPHEAFPFSSRSSRGLDLDHTLAYRFGRMVDGQTHTRNLGPHSRRVHRAKTAGLWKVRQAGRVEFHWTSPLGRRYIVGPRGTTGRPGRLPVSRQ